MSWVIITLEKCTEYITDGDHQPAPKSDKGIHFIKIKDIIENRISFDGNLYVPLEYYERLAEDHKAKKNDILYTVVGSFGIPAFVDFDVPFCFERNIALLHPNKNVIPQFLYYVLKTDMFYQQAIGIANGAAQKLIPLKKLKGLTVSLPPLIAQQRIANILSNYDSLIKNNQKQIKLLEEAAQRLYREWFVDLHFPGYEDVVVVDGVPEGWAQQTLSEIADVVMGQSPKSEFYNQNQEGLPFHQGVGSYGRRFVVDDTYSTSFTRIAKANSVLFSVRAPVGRLNVTKKKIVIGRGLAAMNQKDGYQSYLFYLLKERFFKDNVIGNGSIFASISKDELLGQKFLVPDKSLIMRFNDLAVRLDKKIATLDNQIKLLTQAREHLLPKLMNGELEV